MTNFITRTVYIIRRVNTSATIDAYEGQDGRTRALELVEIHNAIYPSDPWIMVEREL